MIHKKGRDESRDTGQQRSENQDESTGKKKWHEHERCKQTTPSPFAHSKKKKDKPEKAQERDGHSSKSKKCGT